MEKLDARLDDVRSIELDNAFYIEDGKWIESLTISSTVDFDPHEVIAEICALLKMEDGGGITP